MITKKITLILLLSLTTTNKFKTVSANDYPAFKRIGGSFNKDTFGPIEDETYLEFPRNSNNKIVKEIQKRWKDYYDCLESHLRDQKKIEIRHVVEGQYTELTCEICERPFQHQQKPEWKYKQISKVENSGEPQHLYLSPQMLITNNNTLKIYNAITDFQGLYVCYHGRSPVSAIILEVSTNGTMEKVNATNSQESHTVSLEGAPLLSYIQWTDWTECSSCETVGRKFKYGTCMVALQKDDVYPGQVKKEQENLESDENIFRKIVVKDIQNTTTTQEPTQEPTSEPTLEKPRVQDPEKLTELTAATEIITRFETGLPCTSQYMPKGILDLFQNLNTALRVMVKYCKVPCPGSEVFQVMDSAGKVIEEANNSAGIYSLLQKIPQLAPGIERRTIEEEFGNDVIIQCPGTTLSNTPVTWKIHKKIVFPELVANESNGRFTIDLLNRINIQKLRLKDSRVYSCWQRDKLVGTVHLNVNKSFQLGIDHHVTLGGIILVIGTFLLVGVKMLGRELRARKK